MAALAPVATQPTASATPAKKSFYRRRLPCPPAVDFSSAEGKCVFAQALAQDGLKCYFELASQFSTQTEPAYCALGSLTMALNALSVDPGRIWKGSWRWFHDDMLDCCEPLQTVQAQGITLDKAACLGRCNGAHVTLRRPLGESSTREACAGQKRKPADPCCGGVAKYFEQETKGLASYEKFKADIEATCVVSSRESGRGGETGRPLQVMLVSYSRKTFGQTGTGHFSPVAGYHAERELVLIMDVARFKYPPHWVPLKMLWQSMQEIDPATGKPRGYLILSRVDGLSVGSLLSFRCSNSAWISLYSYWTVNASKALESCYNSDCDRRRYMTASQMVDNIVSLLQSMPQGPESLMLCYHKHTASTNTSCTGTEYLSELACKKQKVDEDTCDTGRPNPGCLLLASLKKLPLYAVFLHVLQTHNEITEAWLASVPKAAPANSYQNPTPSMEERALLLVGLVMALDSGSAGHDLWKWTPADDKAEIFNRDHIDKNAQLAKSFAELSQLIGETGMKAIEQEAAHLNYQLVGLESMSTPSQCNNGKC